MSTAETILENKAIRITPMRQLLLRHLLSEQRIVGLNELEAAFPKSDRITIYRTLKTFEEKGIVHLVENDSAEMKYGLCQEACTIEQHIDRHPHFHCLSCGELRCLDTVVIPPVHLPDGYQAKEIRMQIKGICENCES